MSRPRTRPTREETRDRLLRAAARMFAAKGIGATSIEDICDEADFSRGAFYSNFDSKDDLVMELLDANMASSTASVARLYEASASPNEFIANLETDERDRTGPLDFEDGNILYVELLLHALRNPKDRPKLVANHRRLKEANARVLSDIVKEAGRDYPIPLEEAAGLIMAIDLGVNLNRLIDPDAYGPKQFSDYMLALHHMWLSSQPPDSPTD